MEAKELRIGNWFLDNEADPTASIYWQVEEITKEGINYRSGSCWTKSGYIEPIPLTEEWLEKFGFIYYEEVDQFMLEEFDINYYKATDRITKDYNWIDEDGFYVFDLCLKVKSVHQLQNLYFALTGEELKINNKT